MAGELSPDRLFYWDGQQWVSTISADGAWQWDGSAWRSAATARPARTKLASRWLWLIAAAVVATLVVVSGGTYLAWGLFNRTVQSVIGPTCTSPLAQPGHALTTGESLCGGKLGNERLIADCTLTDGVPAGVDLWQKSYRPTESDWVKGSASTDAAGCTLQAEPYTYLAFEASDTEPASAVLVVDFLMPGLTGGWMGMRLACSDATGCIDIAITPEGVYRLDEAGPREAWKTLRRGTQVLHSVPMLGENRMIFRLAGRQADAFIDGVELTQATTRSSMDDGYAGFYLDNQSGSTMVSVALQRMYVFQAI